MRGAGEARLNSIDRRTVLAAGLLTAAGLSCDPARAWESGHTVQGVNGEALRRLAERAKNTKSDAVLVYHNGSKVFEYYSGAPEPVFLMSCVKSITALAVGQAIAEGKIKSIDQPVFDFFPEMKQGRKQAMTIRHLLAMTSGIQNTGSGMEVYPAPDVVKLALAAELTTAPGAAFDYNNKSVNLLSGIIHMATKQPLDDYVRDNFFEPMEIRSWNWYRDDEGNASAMADLALYPEDFAKFGRLILQRGLWGGKQLIPAGWLDQIGQQSQPYEPLYGLLWWRLASDTVGTISKERIEELRKAGLGADFVRALQKLEGRTFHSQSEWHAALASALPDWETQAPRYPGIIDFYASDAPRWSYSTFDGFEAEGSLGQYLTILPKRQLVAVRMIKPFDGFVYNKNRFEDFSDVVRALAPEWQPIKQPA